MEETIARVIVEYKGVYKVKDAAGEYLGRITGKQMFAARSREDYPAVGDLVMISKPSKDQAVIHSVLPRKTIIKRKSIGRSDTQIIAANVDAAFVVESLDRDFSLNRFERYFAIARAGGVEPVIVLNKIDMLAGNELDSKLAQIRNRFPDIDLILTSTVTKEGLDELKNYLVKDKIYCFLGSSGVGKSSLINRLLGDNVIKTESIGIGTGRGKHVTTKREMYFLDGGSIVIDNPGMREVGMADTGAGIDNFFDEITDLAGDCKYADCTHVHEQGCAVLAALAAGGLDAEKYSNYINLKKEADFYELSKEERREKDRQFGKFLKKAKKELRDWQ